MTMPACERPASEWGDDPPLCSTRCMRLSFLTVDGVPYCIECADAWLDRIAAIELRPAIRELLPALGRPEPAPRLRARAELTVEEQELADAKAAHLGELWEREASPAQKAAVAAVRALHEGRAGRRPLVTPRDEQPVTPVEPHEPEEARPAGQLRLVPPES